MPRSLAERARLATAVTQIANRVQANVCLSDGGGGLNVDYGSYLSQHDVVYLAPPRFGNQGMPIGDGDLGAMVWCPDRLRFQVQKSDLWSDPPDGADPPEWRQPSAGAVSLSSSPSFLHYPERFEQRLSLHSGVVTLQSENSHGACQVTAFVSASAGVLVVHYRDQSVRSVERRVEIAPRSGGHPFAVGETAGVLQAFRDRRCALLARVAGCRTSAVHDGGGCGLTLEGARSSDLTLYVAVATSPRNGDPVAMARSRLQEAIAKGFDRLLIEQRQHWGQFWEKSFLRLNGAPGDTLPSYLENLWYLGLYQQACCSRGYDAPLANGGLWRTGEDARSSPAVYAGQDMRAMLASLIPSNHLELSVPYVDTWYRMLPALAARTGSESGLAGARFPAVFNRFGVDLTSPPIRAARLAPVRGRGSDHREVNEGLDTGLLIYEAWRRAPYPFFLRERAYPLLRACTVFAVERCQAAPELWTDAEIRIRIAAALRALLWAAEEFDLEEELRDEWEEIATRLGPAVRYAAPEMQPLGALKPADSIGTFQSLIESMPQQPCGFFGEDPESPDLAFSARLCGGLSGMLLSEYTLAPSDLATTPEEAPPAGFGGVAPAAIQVCAGLPESWGGAFSLIAPGGFRISAEAAQGRVCYVAVKSLLGGVCRIVNPWGPGARVRILQGRALRIETDAAVLAFPTEPNRAYFLEQSELSFANAATVRLVGNASTGPRISCAERIGVPADIRPAPRDGGTARRPADAVAAVASRVERARLSLRE